MHITAPAASTQVTRIQESEGVPVTTIREAMLLRELHHPNVLRLHSVYVANSGSDVAISLIFEFVDHDVHEMMQCQKGACRWCMHWNCVLCMRLTSNIERKGR